MNHKNIPLSYPRRLAFAWTVPEAFRVRIPQSPRHQGCVAQPQWGCVRRFALLGCLPFAMMVLLAGCSSPAVRQQRLVSRSNMTFYDSAVFAYHASKMLPQLEPGYAGSGGGANAGCTSCK